MPFSNPLSDISRVIQMAVAPVFLLTAVGTILGVLSGRLARIVDRVHVLIERTKSDPPSCRPLADEELILLMRRRHLVNLAISCGVLAALLVCLVIAATFVGYLLQVNVAMGLAVLFIGAMAAFMATLLLFLREIQMTIMNLQYEVK